MLEKNSCSYWKVNIRWAFADTELIKIKIKNDRKILVYIWKVIIGWAFVEIRLDSGDFRFFRTFLAPAYGKSK